MDLIIEEMNRFGGLLHKLKGASKHPYMDNTCKVNVFVVADAIDTIESQSKEIARLKEALMSARNPCSGIFDHKWLSPSCVADGCRSLNTRSLLERVEIMQPPPDPHTPSWWTGFCRARQMAAEMIRATLDPALENKQHD